MCRKTLVLCLVIGTWHSSQGLQGDVVAQQPVTLENVQPPGENRENEPLAESFSVAKAAHFLDSASLHWQKSRGCMTCHTNYAYLYARPSIGANTKAHETVRQFAEKLVTERWIKSGPRWDAEVIATAAALAFNDDATGKNLHPTTRQALDRMWTLQRDDGGWSWLKCGWPPMESDDHYGVTLAAIAAGVAPDEYSKTELAKQGIAKLQKFLEQNPAPTLHHQAMVLWASSYIDRLLTNEQRQQCIKELLALQKADGGWGLATLGDWKRSDGEQQDLKNSDGYGTGFVVYVLRQAGVDAAKPSMQRGINWLKAHQRESGRWYTRSLNQDSYHYITHAGTSMAIMALGACNALPARANKP